MNTIISPNYSSSDLDNTFEKNVKIFADQIGGWQLDIANEILNREIHESPIMRHSAFAALSVMLSFIENIGKYTLGIEKSKPKENTKVFRTGYDFLMCGKSKILEEDGLTQESKFFCSNVRNGIYHNGFPEKTILIHQNEKDKIHYNLDENGKIESVIIDPHNLVIYFLERFKEYLNLLKSDTKLRGNFINRWEYIMKIKITN